MDTDKTSYSHRSFWQKICGVALTAGREVIEKALWLYYAAQKPNTPPQALLIIYSALAYFISPIDAIPDITPVAGYADDLSTLVWAVTLVAMNIDEAVKQKTEETLQSWFGGS